MELIRKNKQALDIIADYYFDGIEGIRDTAAAGDKGIKFSPRLDPDFAENIDFDKNYATVANMQPVANVKGTEFAKGEVDLITQVSEFFESIGGEVEHPELGTIKLDRKAVKNDIAHGIGRKKAAAFAAVPDVIRNGKILDVQYNWKARGYDTVVVAAPIEFSGQEAIEGVILRKTNKDDSFYLHEVYLEGVSTFKTGANKIGNPSADTPSLISILQKVSDYKEKSPDNVKLSTKESGSPVKPKFENVTQSQQFKRWFGDWQNHPKSASKVVNKDGTPKVVYHGTNAKFWIFENKNGVHFFSESRDYAESMMEEKGGDRIVEAYLNIRNPLYVRMQEGAFAEPAQESKYIRQAKAEGYDGVVFELNTGNDIVDDTFYVVFNSNQIKSATDNIGTFSKSNPDIRFSRKDDVSVTAKDVQKLQKENDKLTQALDLVRQELKITQGHHVKPAVIDRLAGRILTDYQSTMPKTELVESITQLFDYIGNGERVIWDEVQAGAMNIALNVLDKSTQRNTEWYDATKPARDYLKNTAKAH